MDRKNDKMEYWPLGTEDERQKSSENSYSGVMAFSGQKMVGTPRMSCIILE